MNNMLAFFSILMMLVVAYAHWREGLFTAVTMCVNVFLAGLIAFNFFEPLAELLDAAFARSYLHGYEDFLVLLLLFSATLIALRTVTNNLSSTQIEFQPLPQQFGGALVGLITGYLLSGILVCMLETLPWHESFIDFELRRGDEPAVRSYLPPDRMWLAMMHNAGAGAFCRGEVNPTAESDYDRYPTFDRDGKFEMNYLRYRRHGDLRNPLPYGKR
jgi:hypothetical protein